MCGIAGVWTTDADLDLGGTVSAMTDVLAHRGPDGRGVWMHDAVGIALGHRRLAILDLSEAGAQPMMSASGRYVLTYNGEIYNFEELREEVLRRQGEHPFAGTSDTEVLLAGVEVLGLEETLSRANGMFAFALWDREERVLTLARDRLGIKPVYVGRVGAGLVFASELSAFWRHPGFRGRVDRKALADLLTLNSIPAPRCIYEGVKKLEPGVMWSFEHPRGAPMRRRYWSAAKVATEGLRQPFSGSVEEAVDALEEEIRRAVKARMVSDVPLGAFLSGGVDSSTVVAMMQEVSPGAVKTFSIGFDDPTFNEAGDARRVAEYLGTEHREQYVSADDAIDVIAELPRLYDEPFADSSQIPTYLVSKLARRDVTVVLSGDGGDELFAGYNRHVWAPRIWRAIRLVPERLRAAMAALLLWPQPARVDASYRRIEPVLPHPVRLRIPAEKIQKLGKMIAVSDMDEIYDRLRAHFPEATQVVIGAQGHRPVRYAMPQGASFAERMMFRDLTSYLPDDILTKVDRATMGVALEARVPLLDHRLVAFAWRLPLELKLRQGCSKWILRQVLYRRVPRELIERPKSGFGVPICSWLRGPLRDWAEELLSPARLRREGFFRVEPIRTVWREHLDGRANHQHRLWNVLSFQAWLHNRRRGASKDVRYAPESPSRRISP